MTSAQSARRRLSPFALLALALTGVACSGDAADAPSPQDDARAAWLGAHAIELATLDTTSTDFSDLERLVEDIGDARMVMLGEQSHGDGTTFVAKARLVAFLHQRLGFDVLAFESGTYSMHRAQTLLATGADARQAIGEGVFAIWAGSAELGPLIDYVDSTRETGAPLDLAGFDIQFSGPASGAAVVTDLESLLEGIGAGRADDERWATFATELARLADFEWSDAPPSADDKAAFDAELAALREDVETAPTTEATVLWRRVLLDIEREADRVVQRTSGVPARDLGNLRDQYMGENLVWLADERFSGRKVIVWAATRHTVRNIGLIDGSPFGINFSDAVAMGSVVHDALGDDLYSLGFTSGGGSVGVWWREAESIPAPVPDSLEDVATRAGLEHAIIDLRTLAGGGEWLQTPFVSRPLGHGDMTAPWSDTLDSVLFVRTMQPSTPGP